MGIFRLGRYISKQLGISSQPTTHPGDPHPLPGESEKNFVKRMIPKKRIVSIKLDRDGSVISLYLSRSEDQDLPYLKYLPSLTKLFIENGLITDQGLAHLSFLTGLIHLDLVGCMHLTNDGLVHLFPLTKLKKLDLGGTVISDGGVQNIITIITGSGLVELDLTCSRVTHTGTEKIHVQFPSVYIHHPYYD